MRHVGMDGRRGVTSWDAGALIELPDGETRKLRVAAGKLCSSYRAEVVALNAALEYLRQRPADTEDPVVVCTDSQAALRRLEGGGCTVITPRDSDLGQSAGAVVERPQSPPTVECGYRPLRNRGE